MARIKVQDDELYRASMKFVKRAFLIMREQYKEEDLPEKLVRRIEIRGKGSYTAWLESVPDYSMMILMITTRLGMLPESHSLEAAMKRHKTVGKHIDNMVQVATHGRALGTESAARALLLNTLQVAEGPRFKREAFDSVFERFVDSFRQRKFRFRAFAPLYNFDSNITKLALTTDTSVRMLTNEELEALGTSSVDPIEEGPFWELLRAHYIVEILFKERKRVLGLKDEVEVGELATRNVVKEIRDIVTLTRLLKPSSIYIDRIEVEQRDNIVFDFGYKTGGFTRDFVLGPTSFYSKGELGNLVRFHKKWQQVDFDEERDLYLAIQRYDLAQRRTSPDDRLIDYIIALEALLTRDDRRVYQRLPRLASEELTQEYSGREVSRTIQKAIRYRNSILHAKKADTEIGELETTIGKYVSLIARKRLMES